MWTVVGGLLVAEGLARWIDLTVGGDLLLGAERQVPEGLYREHARLLHEPGPGFDGTVARAGGTVRVRFDERGLRGERDDRTDGWLTVGDSFALGLHVDEAQTFQAHLGETLGVPVWNGGVEGYSTWQASWRYQELASRLDLRGVVLLMVPGNDLEENRSIPDLLEVVEREARADRGTSLLANHSRLWLHARVLQRRRDLARPDSARRNQLRKALSIYMSTGSRDLQELMVRTREALRELSGEAASRGHRLVVAVVPDLAWVEDSRKIFSLVGYSPGQVDLDAPMNAVNELLDGLGIETCALAPALRASHRAGDRPYDRAHGHWTERGHAVVAGELSGCLAGSPAL
ncbi:MAG: hypothetical protein QGG40_08095 [Myxococcota bacterium]|nr:hypothetical protein [Myxococcota bacterium]